jgi:hypothetical protein
MTHMAFGNDTAVMIKNGDFIGAVPGTVLAPDTNIVIMKDDAVFKLDIGVGRASSQTLRIDTVVAAHGVEELADVWKYARFHLTHAAPLDIGGVVVLFVAGHFTAVAPHTGSHVEVKAVLLPRFERRQVDLVVSALHAGIGFVVYETL